MVRFVLVSAVIVLTSTARAQVATWTESDKSDPLHQTSFKEFTLQGKFLIPPHQPGLSTPVLVLDCQPGQRYLRGIRMNVSGRFVGGGIMLGAVIDSRSSGTGAAVHVEYRLDDKKLQPSTFGVSRDYNGLTFDESTISNLLFGHILTHKDGTTPQVQKIVMGVDQFLGGQIQMEFDLPDSTSVADSCGLILHKR